MSQIFWKFMLKVKVHTKLHDIYFKSKIFLGKKIKNIRHWKFHLVGRWGPRRKCVRAQGYNGTKIHGHKSMRGREAQGRNTHISPLRCLIRQTLLLHTPDVFTQYINGRINTATCLRPKESIITSDLSSENVVYTPLRSSC